MRQLAWLIAFFATPALSSAPFYLTVERSFSPEEKPLVRLDFIDNKKPLKLRILAPVDTKAFLTKHRLISRAYSDPEVNLNPAHYLINGLEKINSPLSALRDLMAVDFRKAHLEQIDKPLKVIPDRDLAKLPQKFRIDAPKDFKVVHEQFWDLLRDGVKKKMEVPGFEDWLEPDESSYKQIFLDLPKLAPGIYVAQALQGNDEAQALIQISDLNVLVKQSPQSLIILATSATDAGPAPDLIAEARDNQGHWISLGKLDQNGTLQHSTTTALPGELLVEVHGGMSFGLVSTSFFASSTNLDSLYLFTDRPIFKPGDEVSFKGLLKENAKLKAVNQILLKDQIGVLVSQDEVLPVNSFGSFSGKLGLPQDANPGLYQLSAKSDDSEYMSQFRVQDYKKPTFFLQMLSESGNLRPGSTLSLKLKAERNAGGIPPEARYEIFVYRAAYREPQWVAEAGAGLKTERDYFGKTRGAITEADPQLIYSSIEQRETGEIIENGGFHGTWATASSFDPSTGVAAIELALPPELSPPKTSGQQWTYSVVVKAMDLQGSGALFSKEYFDTPAGLVLDIRTERHVLTNGSKAKVFVRSIFPDGRPAPEVKGELNFSTEPSGSKNLASQGFETDSRGLAELEVELGKVTGKIGMQAQAQRWAGNLLPVRTSSKKDFVLRPGEPAQALSDSADLELFQTEDLVGEGDKIQVVALLPKGWGHAGKETGLLYETLSTSRVESFRAFRATGRTLVQSLTVPSGLSETGFYYSLAMPSTAGKISEKTVSFRVAPRSKILTIDLRVPSEPLEPFTEAELSLVVKDDKGRVQPKVEVSLSVVDKAIYAIQSELRPTLLDFFYPLPRLNLQNFVNTTLKGYGYADAIRVPTLKLGALKPRSKIALRREKDTAAFFPHLVTNEAGEARVRFALPENQTIWKITALAQDSKGRFGEASHEFRSEARFELRLAAPMFMRKSDSLKVPLTLANQTTAPQNFEIGITPRAVSLIPLTGKREVKAKGEEILFSEVVASDDGKAVVGINASVDGVKIATDYDWNVIPKGIVQRIASPMVLGAKRLETPLPTDGKVKALHVAMRPGALGLALRAARYLVSYPYGCTEQLVSSTLPNLLTMELLGKEKEPSRAARQAKVQAAMGLGKLTERQLSDGSFVMWPHDDKGSLMATILALDLLELADEVGQPNVTASAYKAKHWLKEQWEADITNQIPDHPFLNAVWAAQSYKLPEYMKQLIDAEDSPEVFWSLAEAVNTRAFYPKLMDKKSAQDLTRFLKESLVSQGTFANVNDPIAALGFPSKDARMVAVALGALEKLGELDSSTKRVGLGKLAGFMGGGYWHSTFDSAAVILNLRGIINGEHMALNLEKPLPQVKNLSGQVLPGIERALGGFELTLGAGEIKDLVSLDFSGLSEDYWVSADYDVYTEQADVTAGNAGFSVARTLYKLEGTKATVIEPGGIIPKGAEIASVIKVQSSEPRLRWGHYIIIEDPVPAFAESVPEDLLLLKPSGLIADTDFAMIKETQRKPPVTTRVIDWSDSTSVMTVATVWQNTYEGKVYLPPASVKAMYDESLVGYSPGVSLEAR